MNPLTLGMCGKKVPEVRTKHRCGGLLLFLLSLIVELVIELLSSSIPAFRHKAVQPKSQWESAQAEAVLQQCEVRETTGNGRSVPGLFLIWLLNVCSVFLGISFTVRSFRCCASALLYIKCYC